jgi:uncharacterized membrane protein
MYGLSFAIALAGLIVALLALQRAARLESLIADLKAELRKHVAASVQPPVSEEAARPDSVEMKAAEPQPDETVVKEEVEAPAPPGETPFSRAAKRKQAAAASRLPEAPSASAHPLPKADMEQRLASRWFVWIGSLAIAIGGLLFVKYAYDNGLISPPLQIFLGLVLAVALVAAGLWMRRKSDPASYEPAALAAAGLATGFGTIYAAYALYGLIDPVVAFVGLGFLALLAFALSRPLGPLIAALGILGGYGAPALIPSDTPDAWRFFPYLLVIFTAAIFTLRGRMWWWLGYAAIAGAAAWGFLWINSGLFKLADALPAGLFAHAIGLIAFYGLVGRGVLEAQSGHLRDPASISQPLWIGMAGLAVELLLLWNLLGATGHGATSLVLFLFAIAGAVALAWLKQGLSPLAPAAGVLAFMALMSWREAAFHEWVMDEHGLWSTILGGAAPQFLRWMLFVGAALLVAGLSGVFRKQSRSFALLAAGSAVLFPFGAWARVDQLLSNSSWAGITVIAGAALFAAVFRTGSRRNDIVSGILTAGAAAALLFAMDRLFDGVWLALAMAACALVCALTAKKLLVNWLAPIAAAFGSLTAARLFVLREIWGEPSGLPWGAHWPLYGYGLPVLLLYGASRVLNTEGQRRWKVTLEGLTLGLAIALVSLELRALIGGAPGDEPQLLEMAAHVLAWLAAAYGLMYRQQAFSSLVAIWGARILIAVSCAVLLFANLGGLNPVVTEEAVQGNAIFNALLLAYLAPVILLGLIARRLGAVGWEKVRTLIGLLALLLAFAYVTLETKRLFQGPVLVAWTETVAEDYAYSAVWLAFGIAVFLMGLVLSRQPIRHAGLGIVSLVVLKVFLWDMAGLEGLYRIASFLGLGISLVGIGWLYGRFVMERTGLEATSPGIRSG